MTDPDYHVTHLECGLTGERYEAGQLHGLSRVGRPLLVRYDLDGVRNALTRDVLAARPATLWKWRELLPMQDFGNRIELGEVATPILPLTRTAKRLGAETLQVKDEGRLPTGSFKARGLALALSMAKELGVTKIAMPTNGNAGAAAAAYAAAAGIEAVIFCPDETPEINVREIAAFGARVYRVNGQIDDCGKLVAAGKESQGWFDLSTLKEPYRIEGKKTMGLELAEQLGWQLPDVIFYPTGGGTGLIGMWKGFAELQAIGLDRFGKATHGRGTGGRVRADRPRVRGGRTPCDALGGCGDGRCGHPSAAGGRRLPDPRRRARKRRVCHSRQ